MNVLAISGSIRKNSYNTALLHALESLAPAGTKITIADISTLPLYNSDLEAAFPEEAKKLKDAIEAADAVVIATPEYNRSISGVLKDAIDWCSRPWGQNSFAGKPVLTVGVSVGGLGTAVAQSHLRQILLHLDMRVVGQPEVYLGHASTLFDESGTLVDNATKKLLIKALAVLSTRSA